MDKIPLAKLSDAQLRDALRKIYTEHAPDEAYVMCRGFYGEWRDIENGSVEAKFFRLMDEVAYSK